MIYTNKLMALVCAALMGTLLAGEAAPKPAPAKPKAPVRKKLDAKFAAMDYGPFLSASLGAGENNLAYKGIFVKVDKEKNASICFDTEMLRVSAAWTGNGLSLAGRNFADDSNDYPIIEGPTQYITKTRPGWSKDGNREDPRVPATENGPKDGPLPKDWAKYKGLYINGDKVVFAYTVGSTSVLELPGASVQGENVGFTRTLNVGASNKPLELLVCEVEKSAMTGACVAPLGGPLGNATTAAAKSNVAALSTKDDVTLAGVIGAPEGAEWEIVDTRVYLKLPKLSSNASFKIVVAKLPSSDAAKFTAFLSGTPEDLQALTKGGAARWTEKITTQGTLGTADGAYVVDVLTAPEQNPYKSWLRFTAHDFFKDGRAAICTWNGDVWIVSGIDDKLDNLQWKRFATGLAAPMGLKIVDDAIYVNARDQITKLHDLNSDGEADFYENFNNDCLLTTNFHEFCFDLQTDKNGDWYFAKGSPIWAGSLRTTPHSGAVIKMSKDGSTLEVLCSGLRAPNGIGVGPNGEITCSDNQGNWTPMCPINLIKKGAYYGFVNAGEKPKERENPIVWIPHSVDKSTSGQVWVDSDKWGPFKGHMFAVSYDCSVLHVILEKVGDVMQGGVVKLPFAFPSGLMRGRFNPVDGQFYVSGLRGWSSRAAKDCTFQRIRYTGKPANMIYSAKTTKSGFEVVFTNPLDKAAAEDLQNTSAEQFTIVRSSAYGSSEKSLLDPKKNGRDPVEIKSAKLSEDGKTLTLEIPTLKPVTNFILKFKLKSADGAPINQELNYTINALP
ncbi:MAG TPA: DUF6797 domain-containing protein [Planctomycetota bacterium]|nr:DUF6797 domain-containing protein [Planctomycetota bacterium]